MKGILMSWLPGLGSDKQRLLQRYATHPVEGMGSGWGSLQSHGTVCDLMFVRANEKKNSFNIQGGARIFHAAREKKQREEKDSQSSAAGPGHGETLHHHHHHPNPYVQVLDEAFTCTFL